MQPAKNQGFSTRFECRRRDFQMLIHVGHTFGSIFLCWLCSLLMSTRGFGDVLIPCTCCGDCSALLAGSWHPSIKFDFEGAKDACSVGFPGHMMVTHFYPSTCQKAALGSRVQGFIPRPLAIPCHWTVGFSHPGDTFGERN